MAAENNVTKQADLARARSIDFVEQFTGSLNKLLDVLGITRKMPIQEGKTIKFYTSTVTLADGDVAEGDVIPLSKVDEKPAGEKEVNLQKFRKSVTAEAIQKYGRDNAVVMTDKKFRNELQKGIRTDFFTFVGTGTGTAPDATSFQMALARAWGRVKVLFEEEDVQTVAFMNTLDVAEYLGDHDIAIQNVFGMDYVEKFLGYDIVFMTGDVPAGSVYATATDNIVLAHIDAANSEVAQEFELTTDESGYIGITHDNVVQRLVKDTVAVMGMLLFAERLDGIVKVNFPTTVTGTDGADG